VELLRGIRHLLQAEGYSVRGVQKILRGGGSDDVKRAGKSPLGVRRAPSRAQPVAPPPIPTPSVVPPLSATQVGMLRDVVAELAALQAMLSDVERGERPALE
jgi:hypothetical protein